MYFPTPHELAIAIAQTSFSEAKKREIMESVKGMKKDDLSALYKDLLNLNKAELDFISRVEKIDLKYKIEFQKALEAANEEYRG